MLVVLLLGLLVQFERTVVVANNSLSSCEKKLPSAIIIGVKKSGTYALLRYLSINPHIVPALKINKCNLNEIHYFDQDVNYARGVEWYKDQMPLVCGESSTARIVIEKTPGYFRSERAAQRIYEFNPNMKIILIVRDPVRRLQSELTHCDTRQKRFNIERKCSRVNSYFQHLLRSHNESDRRELESNKFIRNSIYYLDLIKWTKYFNMSSIFVVNGEQFIKSPWIELKRLERFLNVSSYINQSHFHFDKNKNFYCINEASTTTNSSRFVRIYKVKSSKSNNITSLLVKKELDGCLGKNKGRKTHVFLSKFVLKRLRHFFDHWNVRFFNLTGKYYNW